MNRKQLFLAVLAVALLGVISAAPVPKNKMEDFGPITDEQLQAVTNNLKQIGLGLHYYEDAMGRLPGNIVDKNGKPLLSWRVVILPYMDEDELYKKFNLAEAWDSDTNKKLIEEMPKIYTPVRAKTKEKGFTFLQGFDGADTVFEAGKKNKLTDITDGCSNTIAVLEAHDPVVWTQPTDLKFDAAKDLPKLGGQFDGKFHAVMGDGSVLSGVSATMTPDKFKKVVTKADGRVVDLETAFGK
jgi:hypothetical protein